MVFHYLIAKAFPSPILYIKYNHVPYTLCNFVMYGFVDITYYKREWLSIFLLYLSLNGRKMSKGDLIIYRTLEDINTVLEYAKLEASDVKPTVQCIYFSQQLDNQSFKLLELNDTVLETLTNGEK